MLIGSDVVVLTIANNSILYTIAVGFMYFQYAFSPCYSYVTYIKAHSFKKEREKEKKKTKNFHNDLIRTRDVCKTYYTATTCEWVTQNSFNSNFSFNRFYT